MEEDLVKRVQELERRVSTLEGLTLRPAIPPAGTKPLSIREFVISKGPKTSVDTTLLIGYYLEKFSNVSPFNLDDLNGGFAQAKEPRPSNPSDTVYKNARRG